MPPLPTRMLLSSPPSFQHTHTYVGAALFTMRGALRRRRQSFMRRQLSLQPPSPSIRRLANTTGPVAALVVTTDLSHPTQNDRAIPSTLQPTLGRTSMPMMPPPLLAQANATLCLTTSLASSPLMTSSPSLQFSIPTSTTPVYLEGNGSFRNGGNPRKCTQCRPCLLVVFVGVTALMPPIHQDHSADANIGLGHPVPHPRPFRWWFLFGGFCCFLFFGGHLGDSVASCCFGGTFWETIF
jgi:hypothetical protein